MSTNARIGMTTDAVGSAVRSIYTHWDGYPTHHGRILFEHYTSADAVRDLLDLGDLSSLGYTLGEKHDFDAHRGEETCNAYGRDREETDVAARTHDPLSWPDSGQEYEYLFTLTDGWQYRNTWPEPGPWKTLDLAAVISELRAEQLHLKSLGYETADLDAQITRLTPA